MAMTEATTTTTTKERVADRLWIDAQGVEVDDEEQATGCRYVDKLTGKKFEYQTGLPVGQHATMLAIFGALTKAGNIRSTMSQKEGASADVIGYIEDWFDELITNGNWAADRVGGGPRFNPEFLAAAIAFAKNETDPTPYRKRIEARDKVKVMDGKSEIEMSYAAYAYRNPVVKQKYNELLPVAANAPSAAEL